MKSINMVLLMMVVPLTLLAQGVPTSHIGTYKPASRSAYIAPTPTIESPIESPFSSLTSGSSVAALDEDGFAVAPGNQGNIRKGKGGGTPGGNAGTPSGTVSEQDRLPIGDGIGVLIFFAIVYILQIKCKNMFHNMEIWLIKVKKQ